MVNKLISLLLPAVSLFIFASTVVIIKPITAYSQGNNPPLSVEVLNVPTVDIAPDAEVHDADNPALQPIQHGCVDTIPAGIQVAGDVVPAIDCLSPTVPSGKRLVIEFVSVRMFVPTGQTPDVRIGTSSIGFAPGTTKVFHTIALVSRLKSGVAFDTYETSQSVRLYAAPGTEVTLVAGRSSTSGDAIFNITFIGYLVDLP